MEVIQIDSLASVPGGSALFEGEAYGASVSFFVVRALPGDGAVKHRHPYDETFVILDGEIDAIIGGEQALLHSGSITVIPATAWHEFTNRGTRRCLMVNVHASPRVIQENWADLPAEQRSEQASR